MRLCHGFAGVVLLVSAAGPGLEAARADAGDPATAAARDLDGRVAELQRVLQALSDDPGADGPTFAENLRAQWQALPYAPEAVRPEDINDPRSIGLLVAVLATLIATLVAFVKARALPWRVATVLAGAGVLLWLWAGYAESGLVVFAAALPAGLGVRWLRRPAEAGGGDDVDPRAQPNDAYAAWLATQRKPGATSQPPRTQAAPQRAPASPSALPAAPAAAARPAADPRRRLAEQLQRLHASGTRTPALDRVIERWQRWRAPAFKGQRTALLVGFLVLFVLVTPLAFLAAIGLLIYELHALKLPNQTFGEFLRQLSLEAQHLQRPPQR